MLQREDRGLHRNHVTHMHHPQMGIRHVAVAYPNYLIFLRT